MGNYKIKMMNEYGAIAQKSIIGLEFMNIGSGISIDDITIDEAMTFIARKITPWHNQINIDKETGLVSDSRDQPARGAGNR